MDRLNLNRRTQFSGIKEFLDKNPKQGELVFKKGQLYVNAKAPSAWNRLLGIRGRQTARASEKLAQALRRQGAIVAKGTTAVGRIQGGFEAIAFPLTKSSVTPEQAKLLIDLAGEYSDAVVKEKNADAATDVSAQPAASDSFRPSPSVNGKGAASLDAVSVKVPNARDMPKITFGGKLYAPVRVLGSGGYSVTFEYRAENGDGDPQKFALKLGDAANETPAAVNASFREESAFLDNIGPQDKNLLHKLGEVEIDGMPALLLELGAHGSVYDAVEKASKLKNKGFISDEQFKAVVLTANQGLAKGMGVLHKKGFVQGDLKDPNGLLDESGDAILMDYGNAREGDTIKYSDLAVVQNALWLSGEQVVRPLKSLERVEDSEQKLAAKFTAAFPSLGKSKHQPALNRIFSNIAKRSDESTEAQIDRTQSFDSKIDVWGWGMSLLHGLQGKEFFDGMSFQTDVQARIKTYMGADEKAMGAPDAGHLAKSTGDRQLDALLNKCLHRDPKQRPTADQILNDDVFTRPGVGTDEARALLVSIVNLADDDIETMTQAAQPDAFRQAKTNFDQAAAPRPSASANANRPLPTPSAHQASPPPPARKPPAPPTPSTVNRPALGGQSPEKN